MQKSMRKEDFDFFEDADGNGKAIQCWTGEPDSWPGVELRKD